MNRIVVFAALLAAAMSAQAGARDQPAVSAIRVQDQRLASIAESMLLANASLCRERMPLTGMVLHSSDQYRDDADGAFGAGEPVAISAVVPRSPAAEAGLRPDDGIAAIGGHPVTLPATNDSYLHEWAFETLASASPDIPISVTVRRHGEILVQELHPRQGCRSLVEVLGEDTLRARSDGRVIQVSYGLLQAGTDDEVAVALAHELAHSILEHRDRLLRAGVKKGFFGQWGANRRLNRQAEVEADRLSVHLLVNAGYDPGIAVAFWRSALGGRVGGGLFRSGIHPSPEERAEQLEEEIRLYLPLRAGPSRPRHLLRMRDQAMP